MDWTVCIPTLKRYDLLVRLCLSLNSEKCRDLNLRICILDNGGDLLDSSLWLMSQQQFLFAKPEVIVPECNLGVAGSWNFFLQHFGACIIANDDVVFAKETIDSFASASWKIAASTSLRGSLKTGKLGGTTILLHNLSAQKPWLTS